MAEHPILFSDEMVRAIVDGYKTQTRRVIRFPKHAYQQPDVSWIKSVHQDGRGNWVAWSTDAPDLVDFTKRAYPNGEGFKCPYGRPRDLLWVRETWSQISFPDEDGAVEIAYRADDWLDDEPGPDIEGGWRPSIHMPRWASRLTLEVINVRVERLQAISEEDVLAEGVKPTIPIRPEPFGSRSYNLESFVTVWDSINAKRGFSWKSNPWVWVVSFKVARRGLQAAS